MILEVHPFFSRCGSHLTDEILLVRGGVEVNPGPRGKAPATNRGPKPKKTFKKGAKAPVKKAKQSGYKTEICKTLGFPASRLCPLRYVIPQQQLTGGGVLNNLRFTSNHYDVDSALGSTAMAYYSELAAVYALGRTISMEYVIDIINDEAALDNQVIHGFSNVLFSSTALGMNYAENSHFKTTSISWKGMGVMKKLHGKVTIEDLFGTKQALYDDLFTGSTTASTLSSSATGYLYVGTQSTGTPVVGCNITGYVTLWVLFTKKRSLTSKMPSSRPNSCRSLLINQKLGLKPHEDPWVEYVQQENSKTLSLEERIARLESNAKVGGVPVVIADLETLKK